MKKLLFIPLVLLASLSIGGAGNAVSDQPIALKGLKDAARITRDVNGIAHIKATNEHDLFFLQGYVHAQDRLFQMDLTRRQASGTLAEVLGSAALPTDVQMRTFGLRRSAEKSLLALSLEVQAAIAAYAEGANTWIASSTLPPEYQALELTKIAPWTAVDSVACAKLIAFGLSFDISDIDNTVALLSYQMAGMALRFDGTALFFADLYRSAPFDPASTVPDASPEVFSRSGCCGAAGAIDWSSVKEFSPKTLHLAKTYLEQVKGIPLLNQSLFRELHNGSNEWAVSAALSATGRPLLANDTHLALGTPSTWYPLHLEAEPINVAGDSFPGVPFVVLGQNHFISWGATWNPLDVTDVYNETIVPDAASPSGLSTIYLGNKEPAIPIPEVFRQNELDGKPDNLSVVPPGGAIPPVTLIVPRRNGGPIISLDVTAGAAISVQFTGFSATREMDTFYLFDKAENLSDFQQALQYFDFGSENWAYADSNGYIAYFTSAELPIREDLQSGKVNGLPPYFIRNGTGGNEWLPVQNPQPGQAIPYEIMPQYEMPHIINPSAGWFVNANNDPAGVTLGNNPLGRLRDGGGIYYLNAGFSGIRAGRITELMRQKLAGNARLSLSDLQAIQADVALLDAEYFVPHILNAFSNAQSGSASALLAGLGQNPVIAGMVSRLAAWNFTTPTGIPEGYDSSDSGGQLGTPSADEIAASVAATIYSVWRGQFIRNTIDVPMDQVGLPKPSGELPLTALRNLLDNFDSGQGVGASGVNFFNVPMVDSAADRRDILILKSLADAFTLLSGDSFAPAFGKSTNLDDYRWGKLHRIVFAHPLDNALSIPPAMGLFPAPLAGLPGFPTDGGLETVDAATHNVRAAGLKDFMFAHGPARRFVSEQNPGWITGQNALPGGISGIPGSPNYFNLLAQYMTDNYYSIYMKQSDVQQNAVLVIKFVPGH